MIGLDTNILVRYIAQDDAIQTPKATALIEQLSDAEPGFISLVSIVELVWVMQGCYAATKAETIAVLDKLLRVRTLCVENADIVMSAVRTLFPVERRFCRLPDRAFRSSRELHTHNDFR